MPNMYSPMPQYAEYNRRSLQELAYMPALLQQRDQEFIKSAQDQVFDHKYLDWASETVQQNLSQFKQRRDQIVDKTRADGWNSQAQQELSKLNTDWYNYSQSQEGLGYKAQSDYNQRQSYLEGIKDDNLALKRFSEAEQTANYNSDMIGKYTPQLRRGEYTFAAPVDNPKAFDEIRSIFSGLSAEEQKEFKELMPTIEQLGNQEFVRFQMNEITKKSNNPKVQGALKSAISRLSAQDMQDWGNYSGEKEQWLTFLEGMVEKNLEGVEEKDGKLVERIETKPIINRYKVTEDSKAKKGGAGGSNPPPYISPYVRMMLPENTSIPMNNLKFLFPESSKTDGAVVVNSDLIIPNFAKADNIDKVLEFENNRKLFKDYQELLDFNPSNIDDLTTPWRDSAPEGFSHVIDVAPGSGLIYRIVVNKTTNEREEVGTLEEYGEEIKNQRITEFEQKAQEKGIDLNKEYKEFLTNSEIFEKQGQLKEVISNIGVGEFIPSSDANNKKNVGNKAYIKGKHKYTQSQLDSGWAAKGFESTQGFWGNPLKKEWEEEYAEGDNALIRPSGVNKEGEQLYEIDGWLELPFSTEYGAAYDEAVEGTADFDAQVSANSIDEFILHQNSKAEIPQIQSEIESQLKTPSLMYQDKTIPNRLDSLYEDIKSSGDIQRMFQFNEMLKEVESEEDLNAILDLKKENIVTSITKLVTENEGTSYRKAIANEFQSSYDVVLGYGKFGRPNKDGKEIPLSSLTVAEVLEFQNKLINSSRGKLSGVVKSQGSSAVGKYQFTKPTLQTFIDQGLISESTIFTPEVQEKLYRKLLEKAGLNEYESGSLSQEQFMDNLSKIWASIPNSKGESSYGQPLGEFTTI